MPPRKRGSLCVREGEARGGWVAEGFRSWPASDREPPRSRLGTSHPYRARDAGSTSCRHPRDDLDLVAAVNLGEMPSEALARRGRDVLDATVGGARELAVRAVHQ